MPEGPHLVATKAAQWGEGQEREEGEAGVEKPFSNLCLGFKAGEKGDRALPPQGYRGFGGSRCDLLLIRSQA